jgi:hypothetical protein
MMYVDWWHATHRLPQYIFIEDELDLVATVAIIDQAVIKPVQSVVSYDKHNNYYCLDAQIKI